MIRTVLVSLLLLTSLAAGTVFAGDRFLLSAGAAYLQPADSGYRDVYGGQVVYPEVKAAVRLFKGLHAMGGFSTFSENGTTPELGLPAKSTQSFFTGGLAFIATATGALQVKVEAGASLFSFKEEALETEVSGSKVGFYGSAGLILGGKGFFAGVDLGYLYASDTVEDVPIKLGGFKASACVGIRF
jgi:hypothetical protein